jgi:hypothetical protein
MSPPAVASVDAHQRQYTLQRAQLSPSASTIHSRQRGSRINAAYRFVLGATVGIGTKLCGAFSR